MQVWKSASRLLASLLLWAALCVSAAAGPPGALARPDPAGSAIAESRGGGLSVTLALSRAVPYRVFTLAAPPRLIVDFRGLDWAGTDPAQFVRTDRVAALRAGPVGAGWSRLVVRMTGPHILQAAKMQPDRATGQARLHLDLRPAAPEAFAAASGAPPPGLWGLPQAQDLPPPPRRQDGTRALRVILDPGHGGIDPGAQRGGVREADLMLTFARELREGLIRAGFDVVLTRDSDHFVPLETRIDIARRARGDVFLSLHADALAEGHASGATVYTLSDRASDRASALLAERHDRDALLAGVDLSAQDDVIASVLMDLARTQSAPRADRLADALVAGLGAHAGPLHKRPRRSAAFSVLKSPDIPSVLVELGFLSSPADRARLTSAAWRARSVAGITAALQAWQAGDAAEAALLRR